MVPSVYHKCQIIVIGYSVYEAILEKKPDNKSQKRRKLCFPERRDKSLVILQERSSRKKPRKTSKSGGSKDARKREDHGRNEEYMTWRYFNLRGIK